MKSLRDKVVVITGAGSGLGRELALLCAKKGAIVAAADYVDKGLKETASMIIAGGGICTTHLVDVSDQKKVKAFAAAVIKKHDHVDVLINNAGIMPFFERFEETSYDTFKKILDVNLWGVIYGCKEFIGYLLDRPESAIVNVASAAGLTAYLGLTPYVASKFAVRGISEAMRMEYMGTGLTVSVVFPGAMATNIFQNSPLISAAAKKAQAASTGNSAHKSTPADVAAKIIIDGMQAKKMKILVGKDAKMQDLFARLMPVGYTKMFYKQMKGYLPKKK